MAAAILVARSPSSAIAIVNELRARGPYTKTALGVTVVMDAVVILSFAALAVTGCASTAYQPNPAEINSALRQITGQDGCP